VAIGEGARGQHLLRELHDEHGPALWRYALSLTAGDESRAQDVVQETMLRAWRHPGAFDADRGSPRAWLYTVARRLVIDDVRSARHRHETVTGEVPERSTADATDQVATRHLLTAAMQRLSPDHQAVLRECYYRGSSVADAARALGIAPGTVKSRTHYALRALRLAVEELGGAE
jgi:RNA polymerase sigma-70 factor (ECF subfamily)